MPSKGSLRFIDCVFTFKMLRISFAARIHHINFSFICFFSGMAWTAVELKRNKITTAHSVLCFIKVCIFCFMFGIGCFLSLDFLRTQSKKKRKPSYIYRNKKCRTSTINEHRTFQHMLKKRTLIPFAIVHRCDFIVSNENSKKHRFFLLF